MCFGHIYPRAFVRQQYITGIISSNVRCLDLQCYNKGHNGHGINLYDVLIILMGNLHAGNILQFIYMHSPHSGAKRIGRPGFPPVVSVWTLPVLAK